MRRFAVVLVLVLLSAVLSFACSGSGKKEVGLDQTGVPDMTADARAERSIPPDIQPDAAPAELPGELGPTAEVLPVETDVWQEDWLFIDIQEDQEPDLAPLDIPVEDLYPLPDLSKEGDACLDVVKCALLMGCFPFDKVCAAPCFEKASDMALWEIGLTEECYNLACADVPDEESGDCLWSSCGMNLFVCAGGEGTGTCGDAVTCFLSCPANDGLCPLECMAQADEQSIQEALTLVYGQQGSDQQVFFWLWSCVGGTGDANCAETSECLQACEPEGQEGDDGSCMIDCMKASSQDAMEQWMDMLSCGENPCMDKMIQCIGGTGDLSCGEALMCMQGCGGGEEGEGGQCSTTCIAQTSPQGAADLGAFMLCIDEKCPESPENCPAAMACLALCPGFTPGPPGQ